MHQPETQQPFPTSRGAVRALLIDLDNCPKQLEQLPETLESFARIVVCYGGTEPKVPLRMVPHLTAAIHTGRLALVGMQKKGKNAADFGLAFWAGRLVAEMPPETEFLIMSQDADLDHVVHMLQDAQRAVERVDGKTKRTPGRAAPARRVVVEPSSPPAAEEDVVAEYCAVYLRLGKSRPVRKVTLANSIRAFCKNHKKAVLPEEILQGLVTRGVVHIDGQGRVTYPEPAALIAESAVAAEVTLEAMPEATPEAKLEARLEAKPEATPLVNELLSF